jgi:hypothetical protein
VRGYRCLDCETAMPVQPAWSGGHPFVDGDDRELTACVGYPSLTDGAEREGGLVSFGYLLSGFRAVGLLPRELVAIQAFLSAHIGHRIRGPLAESVNQPPISLPKRYAGVPRWRRLIIPRFVGTTCEWRMYLVGCPRDSGLFESKTCHDILPIREMTLSPANIDCYLERVVPELESSLPRFHPFRRNFLRILADFLQRHRMHEPRVIPDET